MDSNHRPHAYQACALTSWAISPFRPPVLWLQWTAGRIKRSCFKFYSGSHLLSHTVSSTVPSAVLVLTIVFGMRTGVSPRRITTRNLSLSTFLCRKNSLSEFFSGSLIDALPINELAFLLFQERRCGWLIDALPINELAFLLFKERRCSPAFLERRW